MFRRVASVNPRHGFARRSAIACSRTARTATSAPPRPTAEAERPPVTPESQRGVYGKPGHDFFDQLRALGPRAVLGGIQSNVTLYVVLGAVAVAYFLHFCFSKTYYLTSERSPVMTTRFNHYTCDYAVIENRFTGRRRVVTLEGTPDGTPPPTSEEATQGEETASVTRESAPPSKPSAVVTVEVRINRLYDRVYLFLPKIRSAVLFDVAHELDPFRFVTNDYAKNRHRGVLLTRAEALEAEERTKNKKRGNAGAEPSTSLLLESTVRVQKTRNAYEQGRLTRYEQIIRTVVAETVEQRYRERVLAKVPGSVREVYAHEMLANGTVTGDGVTVADVIPDVRAFEDEVFAEVARRIGEDAIIYSHRVRPVAASRAQAAQE